MGCCPQICQHWRSCQAMNSGLLSERMCCGIPRRNITSDKVSITCRLPIPSLHRQRRDPPVPVPPILAGQGNHRSRQLLLIQPMDWLVSLRSPPLPLAGRCAVHSFRTRAQHASPHNVAARGLEVSLPPPPARLDSPSDSSATNCFNLVFSFSNTFIRLACPTMSPLTLFPPAIVRLGVGPSFLASFGCWLPVSPSAPQSAVGSLRSALGCNF